MATRERPPAMKRKPPRPGKIREIIPIDLERPRDITSPQFNAIKRHVLDLLRAERASPDLEPLDS